MGTGLVAIAYILLILGLFSAFCVVYLVWPEEQEILMQILLTIVPFMIVFTALLLFCCLYLNRAKLPSLGTNSRSQSPKQILNGLPEPVIISQARFVQPVPVWENNYQELQDEKPNYDQILKEQRRNKAKLDFLKFTD